MPVSQEMLAAQHAELDRLRARAAELVALRERECELEAECIAAEVALKVASPETAPVIEADAAARLAEALERKSRVQAMLETAEARRKSKGGEDSSEVQRLKAGRDSLRAWLDAPKAVGRQRLPGLAHAILVAAVLAMLWAGLTVHVGFLVLLVPLGLPLAYLRWSRQDVTWLRVGAKRRFEATGFEPPADWELRAVADRMCRLEESIDAYSRHSREVSTSGTASESDVETLAAELAQAELELEAALVETGLTAHSIDWELEKWLGLVARARRARSELDEVREKRAAMSASVEGAREALFRFLSREGEGPADGRANLDALAEGLERVAAHTQGRDATNSASGRKGLR